MSRRSPRLLAVLGLLLAWTAARSFAGEIPVNVRAEKLRFIEGSGIVEAVGSVEAVFQGTVIRADRLVIDQATKLATAEGNVRLAGPEYRANASRLTYDAGTEQAAFCDFDTTLYPRRVSGPLFVNARQWDDDGKMMLGRGGGLSTCEDLPRHYFLVADRVEYYPNDKMIAYNAVVVVGALPVLWLPIIYYDLSGGQKKNWTFGHNEVEGDYLKTAWGYPLGVLYLDWMEKKGFGHGTEFAYGLGALGAGTLFLYHLDEKDTGITDWVTKVRHNAQLDPLTSLTFDQKLTATYLIPSGRRDQTDLGLRLDHLGPGRWNLNTTSFDDRLAFQQRYALTFNQAYSQEAAGYGFNYDHSTRDPKWIRASQRLTYRRPLSERVFLNTRANYYNSVTGEGLPGDERLEPVVELTGREALYTWRLNSNWYIDLDGDTYTGDENYQFLEKQPELEVAPNPHNLHYFWLRPKFGYGHYREVRYVPLLGRNRDYSSERYQATLDLDRSVPLGFGTTATVGLGLDQFNYTPGDQRYAYRERAALNTALGGFFSNNLNYQKGSSDGNSPFLFDQLGSSYHNVNDTLSFHYLGHFRWNLSGGHNWQTHKWFDVMTDLMARPDQKLSWLSRTGWSIEEQKYRDWVNTVTVAPATFFSTDFSAVSDLNNGDLKTGSVLYKLALLEGQANQWRLQLSQVFEPATKEFKPRDIMVVKDLHCWEMKYTYSDYRKEFSLTFSLKALPGEPVGLSTGRGFYFEGLEKSMKEFKPEGQIQRY